MKTCSACRNEKPRDQFGVRNASPDGLTAACRECLKVRDRARYPKEKERRSAWMREYASGPGKEAATASKRRWIERNQTKRAAHVILGNAIKYGRIEKGPCEVCGSEKVHAHHDDYDKPLEVRWLCPEHHKHHHQRKGEKHHG